MRVRDLVVSMLGIMFIGLKLNGTIDWSWLWVLSPFWVPFALVAGVFSVVFIYMVLADVLRRDP